jgi:hypothetical protein
MSKGNGILDGEALGWILQNKLPHLDQYFLSNSELMVFKQVGSSYVGPERNLDFLRIRVLEITSCLI